MACWSLLVADAGLIFYRKNLGVSVPSRFYNLLAIGRLVILVSEANAEAALTVSEHGLGWVVEPGKPDDLATAVRSASSSIDSSMRERAVTIAQRYDFASAVASYAELMRKLLRS
jgi:colanic acid biosynthesis glycosyl transferase WcaI